MLKMSPFFEAKHRRETLSAIVVISQVQSISRLPESPSHNYSWEYRIVACRRPFVFDQCAVYD